MDAAGNIYMTGYFGGEGARPSSKQRVGGHEASGNRLPGL
jgi:hypothetical protein